MRKSTSSYWKAVRSQAWDEAVAWLLAKPETAAIGVSIAVVAISVLLLIGEKDGALEEVLIKGVGISVILLALPFVYWKILREIPAKWHAEHVSELENAARYIEELTRRPVRMSFMDFAAHARQEGWDFGDGSSYFDFVNAVTQAAFDQHLHLDGREGCIGKPEKRKSEFRMKQIPHDHFEFHEINVPKFLTEDEPNWEVVTYRLGDMPVYRDIHVSNRAHALSWLKKYAGSFKGAHKEWQQLDHADRAKWVAEVRDQGGAIQRKTPER